MFIFLDTETSGNGPADRLCQIAFKTEEGAAGNELFNPGMPISIDAMTVHHITNEMLRDKGSFRGSALWNQVRDLFFAANCVFHLKLFSALISPQNTGHA